MRREPAQLAAPEFLRAAAHPLRWRLIRELAASDRQVHELTARVGQSQNLVSYHLGQLRRAQIVTSRRSSADGRDTYYRLDLARCAALLAQTGALLHPALAMAPPPTPPLPPRRDPTRVLFLCTGNSSRSQMAEAFLNHRGAAAVRADSAGSHPRSVHPDAIRAMAEHGLDLSDAEPTHLDLFTGDRFDHVITLCDKVREICPEFPGQPVTAHWSVPDPARDPDGYPAFQRAAADISQRVGYLLHAMVHELSLEVS
jgi:protein-tyrosine-phosphatase/DNA-binding transcriptional ArsR family regulator